MKPRTLSLFAGYGGLDMAVEEVTGGTVAYVADIDPGACKVLAHRYPDAPNLGDVTTADWDALVGKVEAITGGSPCQDLSHAGRRAGMTEGTRSNLWVAMREAIATIRPAYVIWENVRGAYSASADSDLEHCPGCMGGAGDSGPVLRALGRVLGDLSDLGFDAQWRGLRAADVGACHGRFRVFVVATNTRGEAVRLGAGLRESQPGGLGWGRPDNGASSAGSVALLPTPTTRDHENVGTREAFARRSAHHAQPLPEVVTNLLPTPDASAGNGRGQRSAEALASGAHQANCNDIPRMLPASGWGKYAAAIERQERTFGRTAPDPTELGPKGKPRLSARFVEWMMCLPDGWVTDVPGITRNEALRALGNGVVPMQAAHALHLMLNRARGAA